MNTQQTLESLEKRCRALEDHLEILNLLNSYGPLVDSGSAHEAAELWTDDGGYNFALPGATIARLGKNELPKLYESSGHMDLVNSGVSHFTGSPKITVAGDTASAIAYSFVFLREGERWIIWRAAINEWSLVRTSESWRIGERSNRTLDGSPQSHELMQRVLAI